MHSLYHYCHCHSHSHCHTAKILRQSWPSFCNKSFDIQHWFFSSPFWSEGRNDRLFLFRSRLVPFSVKKLSGNEKNTTRTFSVLRVWHFRKMLRSQVEKNPQSGEIYSKLDEKFWTAKSSVKFRCNAYYILLIICWHQARSNLGQEKQTIIVRYL